MHPGPGLPSQTHAASRSGSSTLSLCLLCPRLCLTPPSSVLPTSITIPSPLCPPLPTACPALCPVLQRIIPPIYIMVLLSSPWTPFLISLSPRSPMQSAAAASGIHLFSSSFTHRMCVDVFFLTTCFPFLIHLILSCFLSFLFHVMKHLIIYTFTLFNFSVFLFSVCTTNKCGVPVSRLCPACVRGFAGIV